MTTLKFVGNGKILLYELKGERKHTHVTIKSKVANVTKINLQYYINVPLEKCTKQIIKMISEDYKLETTWIE